MTPNEQLVTLIHYVRNIALMNMHDIVGKEGVRWQLVAAALLEAITLIEEGA